MSVDGNILVEFLSWSLTYTDPNDNSTKMAIFWRVFMTVLQIMTPGKTARARSVRMVDAVEV